MISEIESCHNRIKEAVIQFWKDSSKRLLYLNMTPGLGKTHNVIKTILKDVTPRLGETISFGYHPPTHRIAAEVNSDPRLYDKKCTYLAGKATVCLDEIMRRLEASGISIASYCESTCKHFGSGCPYYESIRQFKAYPDFWLGVHAHLKTDLIKTVANRHRCQLIILDENPIDIVEDQFTYNKNSIETNLGMLHKAGMLGRLDSVDQLLHGIAESIETIQVEQLPFEYMYDHLEEVTYKDLTSYATDYNDFLLERRLVIPNIITPATDLLAFLKRRFQSLEWEYTACKETFQHTMHMSNYMKEPTISSSIFDLSRLLGFTPRFIVADYETPRKIYERLFGLHESELDYHAIDFRFDNVNIVQVTTGNYGKQVLSNSSSFKRLSEAILPIIHYHHNQKILIISFYKYMHILKRILKPEQNCTEISFEYYFNSRGINKYNDYDVCILFGSPNVPTETIQRYTDAGFDEPSIRYIKREAEMLQCAHRIRLVFGSKYLYLLTKVPLPERCLENASIQRMSLDMLKSYFLHYEQCSKAIMNLLQLEKNGISLTELYTLLDYSPRIVRKAIEGLEKGGFIFSQSLHSGAQKPRIIFKVKACKGEMD